MKKKWHGIFGILIFLLGLVILLYPEVSDRWNRYRDSKLIATYENTVQDIKKINHTDYLSSVREYNRKLIGSVVPDAFSMREGKRDSEYEGLLNVGNDGIMGYVDIPSIDVKLPIYHYTTEDSLAKGAGHLIGSSLPVGGESTHCVISAHRGLPSAKMFTDLNLLKKGDVFYMHVLDKLLAYEIDQILTVDPSDTTALQIIKGKDYVTLVTCTPYGINNMRLLVRGHRIPFDEQKGIASAGIEPVQRNSGIKLSFVVCVVIGILLGILTIFLGSAVKKRRKRQVTQHGTNNKEEDS